MPTAISNFIGELVPTRSSRSSLTYNRAAGERTGG